MSNKEEFMKYAKMRLAAKKRKQELKEQGEKDALAHTINNVYRVQRRLNRIKKH